MTSLIINNIIGY